MFSHHLLSDPFSSSSLIKATPIKFTELKTLYAVLLFIEGRGKELLCAKHNFRVIYNQTLKLGQMTYLTHLLWRLHV